MPAALFLKQILGLTSEETNLVSQVVKSTKWNSFQELLALFPEDDPELATIRQKIIDYINTPTKMP